MARIRTIKPEFWQDERLAALPRDTRMLFIGLWNIADDHGRLRGHPSFIQGQVFPYDHDIDIIQALAQLERAGRIVQYQRDGQRFIWIRKFSDHQKMDKRTDSKLPEPTAQEAEFPAEKLAEPAEKGALEWKGKEGKGKEQGGETAAAANPVTGLRAPEALNPQPDRRQEPRPPPGSDIDFFAWAQNRRTEARPGLLPEVPPPTYPDWFKRASEAVSGDVDRLRSAWLWWLKDDWGSKRNPPYAMRAFQSDEVWRKHVPEASTQRATDSPKASKLNRPPRPDIDPEDLEELRRAF